MNKTIHIRTTYMYSSRCSRELIMWHTQNHKVNEILTIDFEDKDNFSVLHKVLLLLCHLCCWCEDWVEETKVNTYQKHKHACTHVHTLYTYINVRMHWENVFHIHTAQSEGTSQSCDIIVSMQHACSSTWMQHNWVVCVWWGMQWQTYFLSATYMLLIWSYTAWIFIFFNLRGGKVPLLSPGWFHCLWLNTPTNKMLILEAT